MTSKVSKILKGTARVGAMAFGLMLSTSTTASAQNRDWDRDDRYQQNRYDRDRGNTRAAYNRGYSEGLKAGQLAARGRYDSRYNNGYSNGYGYNNGYGNYGAYGNNSYMQQAYQSGYSRGYQEGLNRSRRRSGVTLRIPW